MTPAVAKPDCDVPAPGNVALRALSEPPDGTGTSPVTGIPCLVIVTCSLAATWSSKLTRRISASELPTTIIGDHLSRIAGLYSIRLAKRERGWRMGGVLVWNQPCPLFSFVMPRRVAASCACARGRTTRPHVWASTGRPRARMQHVGTPHMRPSVPRRGEADRVDARIKSGHDVGGEGGVQK